MDRNPYEGDEIRLEMAHGKKIKEGDEFEDDDDDDPENELAIDPILEPFLSFYDAYEYLPFCHRIVWLSSVKEALGYIPSCFKLDYREIVALVILQDEISKRTSHDMRKQANEVDSIKAQATSSAQGYKRVTTPLVIPSLATRK